MKSINTILRKPTFEDLQDWAGETILNRGKGDVERVDQLSRTEDNTLVAWVTGCRRYATSAWADDSGGFKYFCTCPYDWGPCKHTVAVILAAAEQVKKRQSIPLLDKNDDLSEAVYGDPQGDDEVQDDGWEGDDSTHTPSPLHARAPAKIAKILGNKSREELLDLLTGLSRRFPEVRQHMVENEQLATGQLGRC